MLDESKIKEVFSIICLNCESDAIAIEFIAVQGGDTSFLSFCCLDCNTKIEVDV